LARVQDPSTSVLDALYAEPAIITPILTKNTESFINYLVNSLISPSSKPARPLLRTHLTFVASHFCPAVGPSTASEIFYKIFFPFLLFSKPRHRTAEAVWEIILKSREHGGLGTHELLGGCHSLWEDESDENTVEKMSNLNIALASKIAGKLDTLCQFTYSGSCEH
jgi:U3 small nucleolar RNA-associated protein 10